MAPLSRRRLLTIAAGSAAVAALARPANALSSTLIQWRGTALGAEARLAAVAGHRDAARLVGLGVVREHVRCAVRVVRHEVGGVRREGHVATAA